MSDNNDSKPEGQNEYPNTAESPAEFDTSTDSNNFNSAGESQQYPDNSSYQGYDQPAAAGFTQNETDATQQFGASQQSGGYGNDSSPNFGSNDQTQQFDAGNQQYGYGNDSTQQFGATDQTQQFGGQSYGQQSYDPNQGYNQNPQFAGSADSASSGYPQYAGSADSASSGYPTQQYNGDPYGQYPGANQYGQGQSSPWQSQAGGGGGYPPNNYGQNPYGYGDGEEKGKGPLIAWIVLGVLLLAGAVVGILFATGVLGGEEKESTSQTETDTDTNSGGGYGSDPELDGYWDACEAGDMTACDELYWNSPVGTEYEEFGSTCGGTSDATRGSCADDETTTSSGGRNNYGDDPELDALYDQCEAGDMEACDDLYWDVPYGSGYEEFAMTCGGTTDGENRGDCASSVGSGSTETSRSGATYGSDPELDALYDECEAGDNQACDDLYWNSPVSSEYEEFARTCGGRGENMSGLCVAMLDNEE